jgi:DNA polymerase III, alpha subunit
MEHDLDIERRVRDGLLEIGRKLGIPPVVTNDSHYTRESDAESHDLLLCIQTGKTLADADRFRLEGGGYYIKSAAEMYRLNSSDIWQEGCRNSQLLIADRVDASGMFEFINLMPRFPIPEGYASEDELFRAEVWQGMDRRYPDGYDEQRRHQAEYEIRSSARWASRLLPVVADFIMWAKNNGVAVGPAEAPRQARSSPTRWASPTWTRSSTA